MNEIQNLVPGVALKDLPKWKAEQDAKRAAKPAGRKITVIKGSFVDPVSLDALEADPAPEGHYSVFVASKEEAEALAARFPKSCRVRVSQCSGFKRDRTYGLDVHFPTEGQWAGFDYCGIAYNVSFRFETTQTRWRKENKITGSVNETAIQRAKRIVAILREYVEGK